MKALIIVMKYHYSPIPLIRALRALFVPDLGELAATGLLAAITYAAVSFDYWLDLLFNKDQQLKRYSYELFSDAFTKVGQIPNSANVVTALLWGAGGIALYIVLVLVLYFFATTQNNTQRNQSLQGKPGLLAFSLLDEYRRIAWIILCATCIVLTIFSLLPYWLSCFSTFNATHQIKYIIIGLVGLTYNLYLIYSSGVIAFRNPKILA